MRRALRLLAAGLCLVGAAAAFAQGDKVSRLGEYRGHAPVLYSETVRTSSYLRLRDGTRLAMDLYRPAVNGKAVETPHPVLWEHSLSRRSPPDVTQLSVTRRMPELVKYGYVVAYVERRGLGSSFGARRGYNDRTEARDAYDVTTWLGTQPWSTGKVAVFGCSNTGDAAMHAATFMPPHLKAVFAGCFSWSKYDGFLRGGILANWGVGPERPVEEGLKNPPVDGDEDRTLLKQAIEDHRHSTPLAAMWRSLPFRDSWSDITGSRFWLEGSAGTSRDALARSGAAYYIFGGWMDDFRREGLVAWANLQKNPARVVIGPWTHCRSPDFDLLADAHRFFDKWLKGIDNGIDRERPVHLYAQHAPAASAWRSFPTWPMATAAARTRMPLAAAEVAVGKPTPCAEAGSQTQACSQAANGARFTGPVLATDTEYTGHPIVQLWLASPVPDQNVFVYLEDLAPDGTATVVTDGRLKASLRATHTPPYDVLGLPWQRSLEGDREPLVAGTPVRVVFDLLPLSYVFKAGHRVRVVITGNDPRERLVAPTGHTLALFSSAERASFIELPTAPASSKN
jgi:uncharacterized protein